MTRNNNFVVSASRIYVFPLFFFFTVGSNAHSLDTTSSCAASSCGEIRNISFPFRLRTDPISCGYQNDPRFVLHCLNNLTILNINSTQHLVKDIDYHNFTIRLADPSIDRNDLSSCPAHSTYDDDWQSPNGTVDNTVYTSFHVNFIHCSTPSTNSKYIRASFCGNRNNIFSNSSEIFSYVLVVGDQLRVSELEDTCAVDKVVQVSAKGPLRVNSSLAGIYDGLAYGSEHNWFWVHCGFCERKCGSCTLEDNNKIDCIHGFFPLTHSRDKCIIRFLLIIELAFLLVVVILALALRFLIGFTMLIALIIWKWRRKHKSMDESIEEFLQSQNNLTPINYTYRQIKKMTNNFNQKLGQGGYGTVYRGKLRSGPYVAVKLMDLKSTANEQEFISEVSSIGRIHHFNIVQLIGFSVHNSKCALVYEYLPNGSLDRYIFGEKLLDGLALKYEKIFEVALGVARGIDYLHHGCDMQILHFDIKPHNILLDENFNPKISDFGLAKLSYPTSGSSLNNIITDARGTMGYMAPEMFYKNIGRVSYKADVYSYGMLLMEMAGRRRNMNPFEDDVDRVYFPSWVYDQVCAGREIEMVDAGEEEKETVKKIMRVALWCIQMNPSDRPSMNKVIEMLEVTDYEVIRIPPKPFLAPREVAHEDNN